MIRGLGTLINAAGTCYNGADSLHIEGETGK
jgi:hypothetical protein